MISSSKFLWKKDCGFASDKELGWNGNSPAVFKVQSDRTGDVVEFHLDEQIRYTDNDHNLYGVDSNYESKDGWKIQVTWYAY